MALTAEQVAENETNFQIEAIRRIVQGSPVMIGITSLTAVFDFIAQHVSDPAQRAALAQGLRQVADKIEAFEPPPEH